LDVERVRRELADGTHRARVRKDFSTGIRSGVNGTPTFYITESSTTPPTTPQRF